MTILNLSNLHEYYEIQDQNILLFALSEKFSIFHDKIISEYDGNVLKNEIENTILFSNSSVNYEKIIMYNWIGVHLIESLKDILSMDSMSSSLSNKEVEYLQTWVSFAEHAQESTLQLININFSPLTLDFNNMLKPEYSDVISGWYFGIFSLMLANCVKFDDFQDLYFTCQALEVEQCMKLIKWIIKDAESTVVQRVCCWLRCSGGINIIGQ